MAEPDVGADAPLSPQLFDGGVHVKGVPGDDSVRDEVQAEDLVGLLISLTALDLALVSEEQGSAGGRGGPLLCSAGGGSDDGSPRSRSTAG